MEDEISVEESAESTEGISYSDLADQDFGTALTIGALPIALFAILLVIAVIVYVLRKKSAWSPDDLGEEGESHDPASSDIEFPTTEERSKMDETEPAKKL
jgi:hypothetical protein